MKTVVSLAVMVVLALSAFLPASAGAADRYWSYCGTIDYGSGIYDLKSHNIHCSIARFVAKHYYKRGDHQVGDFRCRSHQEDEFLYFPVCKGNVPGQIIKFRTVVAPGVE